MTSPNRTPPVSSLGVAVTLLLVTTIDTTDAYVSGPLHVKNSASLSSNFASRNRLPMPMQSLIKTQQWHPKETSDAHLYLSVHRSPSRSMALHALSPNSKDNDPEEDEAEADGDKGNLKKVSRKAAAIWKLLVTKFMNFFPTLRTAVTSFTVGAIFALSLIFIPVYNSVDKMSEPVTLFETILAVSDFINI